MATRDTGGQQQRARRTEETETGQDTPEASSDLQDRIDQITEDNDAILDEIDEVLEANAEDFVKAFVQKGGQ